MDLIQAKIAEVKNLDLIYAYSIDSIFGNDNNKYVGLRIVFDKNKTLSLDYRNKYFPDFVRKVLDRYNKEQNKRKIVLLGDLSKRLVTESSFAALSEEKQQGLRNSGIAALNTSDDAVVKYYNYLQETIKLIIQLFKGYDTIKIDSISGYNHKYVVTYSIGSVSKTLPILLSQIDDNNIDFIINRLDETRVDVKGNIYLDGGRIEVTWKNDDLFLAGQILYDAKDKAIERKVTSYGSTIYYSDTQDTLLDEDMELLKFYYDLCEIPMPSHILKTGDNSYLLADETTKSNEEDILYTNTGSQFDIDNNWVRLRYRIKNGFTKYNNQINMTLDEEFQEIIFRKFNYDDKDFILMERKKTYKDDTYFDYFVYEVDSYQDLTKPFNVLCCYPVSGDIKTLDSVKKYVKCHKGEINNGSF